MHSMTCTAENPLFRMTTLTKRLLSVFGVAPPIRPVLHPSAQPPTPAPNSLTPPPQPANQPAHTAGPGLTLSATGQFRACTWRRHIAVTASILEAWDHWNVSYYVGSHGLVINQERICHYRETLLCLKPPRRFSCETWRNKVFISPGFGMSFDCFRIWHYSNSLELSLICQEYRQWIDLLSRSL